MSFEFKVFNEIVTGSLRPWIAKDKSEQMYKSALADVQQSYYTFQPLYQLEFTKSLSVKRDYYLRLADNEATDYLNFFKAKIDQSINDDARIYLVTSALQKVLPSKLNRISRLISDYDYTPAQYDPTLKRLSKDILLADGSFVFHYLKHSFIRLYLEIQDNYKDFVADEIFSAEDLYLKFFNEAEPEASIIVEAHKIKLGQTERQTGKNIVEVSFNPIQADIRKESKGILDYPDIIKNPMRFAQFEKLLFSNGYIDEDYNFTNKHGYKIELAMIYRHLIKLGYFHAMSFQPTKRITDLQIRKFLDYRYATDVDKQFRNLRDNPEQVADFVESHFWLFNLPAS